MWFIYMSIMNASATFDSMSSPSHDLLLASCSPSLSVVTYDEKKLESPEVLRGDVLCSSTRRYLIKDFCGEGSFGKVAKGVNVFTSQDVAIKILHTEETAEREVFYFSFSAGYHFSHLT